ncbi:hypothetical protein A0H76_1844 [Hepatospora eriocheir]|uniref:Uncharacterized protein n=1 Tax=Hepatospora eriocheir TaxID=1081669 RepID=A0A1X0QGQ6_9MICR|nr:hypothetical protein A0H76_1844 [Hepatospora eriocheir]
MAKLHSDDPLDLKLLNDSCPGVSIINIPGKSGRSILHFFISISTGKKVAPICCVIPPASNP